MLNQDSPKESCGKVERRNQTKEAFERIHTQLDKQSKYIEQLESLLEQALEPKSGDENKKEITAELITVPLAGSLNEIQFSISRYNSRLMSIIQRLHL